MSIGDRQDMVLTGLGANASLRQLIKNAIGRRKGLGVGHIVKVKKNSLILYNEECIKPSAVASDVL